MNDRGIGVEQAKGMLNALRSGHECGAACTGEVVHGDGRKVQLTCPYAHLDVGVAADRRIIGTLYASEARALVGATQG